MEMTKSGALDQEARHPNVIVMGVKNETELNKVRNHLSTSNIHHRTFSDHSDYLQSGKNQTSDSGIQLTAIATAPIRGESRKLFKKYNLLQP